MLTLRALGVDCLITLISADWILRNLTSAFEMPARERIGFYVEQLCRIALALPHCRGAGVSGESWHHIPPF